MTSVSNRDQNGEKNPQCRERSHQIWSYGMSSGNDAAAASISVFNREILLLGGGGIGGDGKDEGVDGREQIHFDRVERTVSRLEKSCVVEVVELFVGKSAPFPLSLYMHTTENLSAYLALGGKEPAW